MRIPDLIARLRARWGALEDVTVLSRENRRLAAMLVADAEVIADLSRDKATLEQGNQVAAHQIASLRSEVVGFRMMLEARDQMLDELEARLEALGAAAYPQPTSAGMEVPA